MTKRTYNDLQNITQKTKDQTTRIPLKTGGELRCSRRVTSSCSTYGTCRVTLVTNPVISHERGKAQIVNDYDKQNITVVIWDTDIP